MTISRTFLPEARLWGRALVGGVRHAGTASWVLLALLIALGALAPSRAAHSLAFTTESLLRLAPFLGVSVLFAAWSRASSLGRLVSHVFAGRAAAVVPVAAAFGALSPFCSCGVVPVVAALLAGYGTWLLQRGGAFQRPLRGIACACDGALSGTAELRFWREPERRAAFRDAALDIGAYLLVWMALAFVLESLMLASIPAEAIGGVIGAGWASVPLAALFGVPAYLNGYAAIPTVAGLLELGLPPAAGLAFMIAGGVTSVPAALAVFPLVRRGVFTWYLALGLGGALAAGFAWGALG